MHNRSFQGRAFPAITTSVGLVQCTDKPYVQHQDNHKKLSQLNLTKPSSILGHLARKRIQSCSNKQTTTSRANSIEELYEINYCCRCWPNDPFRQCLYEGYALQILEHRPSFYVIDSHFICLDCTLIKVRFLPTVNGVLVVCELVCQRLASVNCELKDDMLV